MKRIGLIVATVFMIVLPLVQAAEIQYFSFEGFAVVNVNVGVSKTFNTYNTNVLIGSTVISHDPKAGRLIITGSWQSTNVAFDAHAYVVVTTNSGETFTSDNIHFGPGSGSLNYDSSGTFTITITKPISGNSIQIDLYVNAYDVTVTGSSSNSITVTFDSVRAYFLNDDHQGIISNLTSYTPQTGVLGQALKLANVEVLMNPVNLSTGTITFSLKWDGTQTVILQNGDTDVLWIDSSGYINIRNDVGAVFKSNSTLQPNTWQKIVIAFQSGTLSGGYIAIDSNQTSISWMGNFIADRVGDEAQSTNTLIDELHIYNEYMTLSEATTGTMRYILIKPDGSTILVSPEGGQDMGNVSASALDAGGNVLASTVLSPQNKEFPLPNGTVKVVLSRDNVQRTFFINMVNNIVFPATGTTIAVLNIKVTPGTWNYFIAKTADGKVATAVELNDNAAGFAALVGHQYLFTFEAGNITRVRAYTVTSSGDLVFYIQDLGTTLTPPLDVQATYKDGMVIVSYYDRNLTTNWLNVTMTAYEGFKKAWEVHDERSGTWGLYVLKANGTADYVEVTIVANVSGEMRTFRRVVYPEGPGAGERSPFPTTLIPPALVFLITAALGMFVFNEPALMLIGAAASLSLMAVLGWIPAVPGLIAVLGLLGVLGLILYRR